MNKKFEDYFKNILKEADYKEFISQIKSGSVRRGMRVNRLLAPLGINEVKSDFTKLLEPCEGDYILDLCASPGSKTTQIASEVGNRAVVIANEITPNRYVRLRENLQHFGVVCHAITGLDPGFFAKNYPNTFDRILVDAPCSGEGMYFKFPAVIDHWNPKTIRFNAKRQRKILTDAFIALKPGGRLVYSTCTLNLEENEKVVAHILKKFFQNAEIVNAIFDRSLEPLLLAGNSMDTLGSAYAAMPAGAMVRRAPGTGRHVSSARSSRPDHSPSSSARNRPRARRPPPLRSTRYCPAPASWASSRATSPAMPGRSDPMRSSHPMERAAS